MNFDTLVAPLTPRGVSSAILITPALEALVVLKVLKKRSELPTVVLI